MKKRKFLLLILLVLLVYGLLLSNGLVKRNSSNDLHVKDFVVSEEEKIANLEWNNNLSEEELVVWNEESGIPMVDEETSEGVETMPSEESKQTEEEDTMEEVKVSESVQPSKTPVKENESSVKPNTTPESKPSLQPSTTPENKPSVQPSVTPESKPSVQPGVTPESKPSVQPSVTPESKPSEQPSVPESTPEASNPPEEPKKELVKQGEYDLRVIPDKFNTGCKNVGSMMKINEAMLVDGVEYSMGDNGNTVLIDLQYRNQEIADDIVIRNVDFSGKKFAIRNSPQTVKRFTFENCKFDEAATVIGKNLASAVFKNCSFIRFYGSNSTFYNCSFGGSVIDGMNPFSDVYVYNSYFSNFDHDNPEGTHTDAIQIYGKEGIDAENIFFENCRVELPGIKDGRNTKITGCFMVGLEYSNAKNLLFQNCIISGGSYSIYASHKKGDWLLENVVFNNVSIGAGRFYGGVYPTIDSTVQMKGIKDTENLYVASVWKDGAGKVHLSVTNDTFQDRHLVVETASGRQEFYLPCQKTVEQNYKNSHGRAPYSSELSIDVEVVPDAANPDWVICYDKYAGVEKQIRFVNWSGGEVYR